jgi:hypothetical protein
MKTETTILSTSTEAAQRITLTGWVARGGQFWGEDERMARWCGATHVPCSECGAPVEKTWTKCAECRRKADDAKWVARERKPYDGGWVYAKAADRWFEDEDEIRDYLDTYDEHTCESLRLVPCDPEYASELDADELFIDQLPEDTSLRDVSGELDEWISKVNECIRSMRKGGKPLSWMPSDRYAVDIATLPADLRRESAASVNAVPNPSDEPASPQRA